MGLSQGFVGGTYHERLASEDDSASLSTLTSIKVFVHLLYFRDSLIVSFLEQNLSYAPAFISNKLFA